MVDEKNIVFDLLYIYSKELSKKYSKWLIIDDCDYNGEVFTVFIDKIKNRKDYVYDSGYRYYLKVFKDKCKCLVEEISGELPNELVMIDCYETIDDEVGYNGNVMSCHLDFWVGE